MRKLKRGTLKSRTGTKVKDPRQAIAIGLSEARERGAKVPRPRRRYRSKKYGAAAQKSIERAVRKQKRGTLKSGRSGKKVRSVEQAVAIGISEARRRGAKVPRRRTSSAKRNKRHPI
jgi:hypothetical protein